MQQAFSFRNGDLYAESVRVADVVERFGTPLLVYSADAIRASLERFAAPFAPISPRICYAVKACGNVGVLRTLAEAGASFTAVGAAELERAWLSGAPMDRVVFAGLGKTDDDVRAALDGLYSPLFQAGVLVDQRSASYRGPVGLIVAESAAELDRLARIAGGLRVSCRVLIRVAADEDAPSESKFGVPIESLPSLVKAVAKTPAVRIAGLHAHAGAESLDPRRLGRAVLRLTEAAASVEAAGTPVGVLDIGGGFAPPGTPTTPTEGPTPEDYAACILDPLEPWAAKGTEIILEPGRAIAANTAALLVSVLDTKPGEDRTIAVCDAGTDESRPATADASRLAWPAAVTPGLEPPGFAADAQPLDRSQLAWTDLVGPSGFDRDAIARGRLIPPIKPGDAVAVFGTGAYARDLMTTPDERRSPAEVLVDQYHVRLTRPRRTLVESLAPEIDAARPTSDSPGSI